jgi:hypothetical protein
VAPGLLATAHLPFHLPSRYTLLASPPSRSFTPPHASAHSAHGPVTPAFRPPLPTSLLHPPPHCRLFGPPSASPLRARDARMLTSPDSAPPGALDRHASCRTRALDRRACTGASTDHGAQDSTIAPSPRRACHVQHGRAVASHRTARTRPRRTARAHPSARTSAPHGDADVKWLRQRILPGRRAPRQTRTLRLANHHASRARSRAPVHIAPRIKRPCMRRRPTSPTLLCVTTTNPRTLAHTIPRSFIHVLPTLFAFSGGAVSTGASSAVLRTLPLPRRMRLRRYAAIFGGGVGTPSAACSAAFGPCPCHGTVDFAVKLELADRHSSTRSRGRSCLASFLLSGRPRCTSRSHVFVLVSVLADARRRAHSSLCSHTRAHVFVAHVHTLATPYPCPLSPYALRVQLQGEHRRQGALPEGECQTSWLDVVVGGLRLAFRLSVWWDSGPSTCIYTGPLVPAILIRSSTSHMGEGERDAGGRTASAAGGADPQKPKAARARLRRERAAAAAEIVSARNTGPRVTLPRVTSGHVGAGPTPDGRARDLNEDGWACCPASEEGARAAAANGMQRTRGGAYARCRGRVCAHERARRRGVVSQLLEGVDGDRSQRAFTSDQQ